MNQEEEHLEVDDMRKEIDEEFELYTRCECLDESGEEESEYEESEEESEYEEEGMLCRIFDGRIFYCHCNESIETELDEKESRN